MYFNVLLLIPSESDPSHFQKPEAEDSPAEETPEEIKEKVSSEEVQK